MFFCSFLGEEEEGGDKCNEEESGRSDCRYYYKGR